MNGTVRAFGANDQGQTPLPDLAGTRVVQATAGGASASFQLLGMIGMIVMISCQMGFACGMMVA